jgi:hypothetical protein
MVKKVNEYLQNIPMDLLHQLYKYLMIKDEMYLNDQHEVVVNENYYEFQTIQKE